MSIAFSLHGLKSASQAARMEIALNALPGIQATIDLAQQKLCFAHPPPPSAQAALAHLLQQHQLSLENPLLELTLEGMSCGSCALGIEKSLRRQIGVKEAAVNFASKRLHLMYNPFLTSPQVLLHAIQQLGYQAFLPTADPSAPSAHRLFSRSWPLLFSGVFTLLLLFSLLCEQIAPSLALPLWLQGGLATFVQFGIGWPLYVSGYRACKNRLINTDLLLLLGSSAGWISSTWALFSAHPLISPCFAISATVITWVFLSRNAEAHFLAKTSTALYELLALQPSVATVEIGASWMELPLSQVFKGMVLIVRPGMPIPADGVVVEGLSTVDETPLNGASRAAPKSVGSRVFAGTLNQTGTLKIRAESLGKESRLGQIMQFVESAQTSKAPAQKLADRVCACFVPLVILGALATFASWIALSAPLSKALLHTLSVLIVASPCMLAIATAPVINVAIGLAAKQGLLIKSATALEKIAALQTDSIDKMADLGIAVGFGSDTAWPNAEVVIMQGHAQALPELISLARAAKSKMVQNLSFAFLYNCLAIALAALGLLPPLIAAAAVAVSPLCIIFNALALKRGSKRLSLKK